MSNADLTRLRLTEKDRIRKMGTQETVEMNSHYLPLTEYSSKYKVSISTLRRRIKSEEIKFVFDDGKYMILDEPVGKHQKVHRPSPSSETTSESLQPELRHLSQSDRQEPILSAANRLLTELKRAYMQVLQEKEEQILQLNAENADLKTLVRTLEMENDRTVRRKS